MPIGALPLGVHARRARHRRARHATAAREREGGARDGVDEQVADARRALEVNMAGARGDIHHAACALVREWDATDPRAKKARARRVG